MEELVAEALQLEGFLVEVGLPTLPAKQGGRHEADVVGARLRNGKMEIRHYEISEWLNFGRTKEMAKSYAKRKFAPEISRVITEYFSERFKGRPIGDYRKLVISKQVPKGFPEALKRLVRGCEVVGLDEYILGVAALVKKWKEDNETGKGKLPELRQGLWLLKEVEFLSEYDLLRRT